MVIRLSVRTRVDLETIEAGVSLLLIRITANVRIPTPSGWSHPRVGILDTGNPVTLIPRRAWAGASVDFLRASSQPIYGLGSTEANAIRGRLGRVTMSLEDEQASSPPIEIIACLLDDDRAPLLLGCEGILTRATLATNLGAGQASLTF
jgi:hypothetical protein